MLSRLPDLVSGDGFARATLSSGFATLLSAARQGRPEQPAIVMDTQVGDSCRRGALRAAAYETQPGLERRPRGAITGRLSFIGVARSAVTGCIDPP